MRLQVVAVYAGEERRRSICNQVPMKGDGAPTSPVSYLFFFFNKMSLNWSVTRYIFEYPARLYTVTHSNYNFGLLQA